MEDQELQHLLHENLRLAKENNRILVKLQKFQRFQKNTKILYWIIIVAIGLGAYYYVKPYIDNVYDIYNTVFTSFGDFKHLFESTPQQ